MTAVRPPTPAEETALRVLPHADADRLEPSPDAYSRIRSRRLVALLGLVARTFAARPDGIDHITQNGAPARTEAPPMATDCKGVDAVHHLTYEDTPRGRQLIAALALCKLLEAHQPEAEWRVTKNGALCGHVSEVIDTDARRALDRYAEFLAAPIKRSQGRYDTVEYVHLHVEATYRGAPVTVWTHVDVRPLRRAEVRS